MVDRPTDRSNREILARAPKRVHYADGTVMIDDDEVVLTACGSRSPRRDPRTGRYHELACTREYTAVTCKPCISQLRSRG